MNGLDASTRASASDTRRVRRRFGLASLFVALTAAAIGLQLTVLPIQREKRVIDVVQRLGGQIRFRDPTGFEALMRTAIHGVQNGKIDFVDLRGRPVNDDALRLVLTCRTIRQLDVSLTEVTDASVAKLASHRQLELLGVSGTRIGDRSMKTIGRLVRLRFLDVGDTRVTSAGVGQLGALSDLRSLRLGGTSVDDECMGTVTRLPNLWLLDISRTRVTDQGLTELANCQSLGSLSVNREAGVSLPRVTDVGAAAIGKLSALTYLHLAEQELTDIGLKDLASLPSLEQVYVECASPNYTATGLQRLRETIVARKASGTAGASSVDVPGPEPVENAAE